MSYFTKKNQPSFAILFALLFLFVSIFAAAGCHRNEKIAMLPEEKKESEKEAEKEITNNKKTETITLKDDKSNTPKKNDSKNDENQKNDENLQNQNLPTIIGNVTAENQSSLAFLNSGTIEKIYVHAGDQVKQGQILASLNDTKESVDFKATEIKLKQQHLVVELEKKKLQRITQQFEAGVVNQATMETEKNTYDSNLLELEQIKNDLAGKSYALKTTKIAAPYDGIISQKNNSTGDFVTAGSVVFQITQNKNIEIYAKIPSIYLSNLKNSMTLTITSSSNKNATGEIKIKSIIPVLDKNTRTFDIYASVKSFSEVLNPGDFVEIKL